MLLEEILLAEKGQLTVDMFWRRNYTTGICQEREARTTALRIRVGQTLASATGLFLEEVLRVLTKELLSKSEFCKASFLDRQVKKDLNTANVATEPPDYRKCFCRTPDNSPTWLRVMRWLVWENWFKCLPSLLSVLEAVVSEVDHAISEDRKRCCKVVPDGLQAQCGEALWWHFHLENSGKMWCTRPDKIQLSQLPSLWGI